MFGAIFVMKIKPGHKEHLIEALKEHGSVAAATEPGLRRFDIYPDPNDPNRIWFYEAYEDEEAFNVHLKGPSHVEKCHVEKWVNFGREHCMDEWPPTIATGLANSIWTPEDGDG